MGGSAPAERNRTVIRQQSLCALGVSVHMKAKSILSETCNGMLPYRGARLAPERILELLKFCVCYTEVVQVSEP